MVFRHIDGRLYAGDFNCIEMGDWELVLALTDSYRGLHKFRDEPIEQFSLTDKSNVDFDATLTAII